ncbi:four helix bundle protein [Prevotella sp.]|uniref:four helix bundle protein n=1 Tax=uncultured Prevotella sp. TaxID=159272 RepID=UPI002600F45C|nr:four helix bundle protein [Prevotella sp.]
MDDTAYNRGKSPLHNKSYAFAKRIVNMVKYIDCPNKMISLTNQIFRSGTAIGALVREAEFAQSPSDFINKLHIALKECNETVYWLNLLYDTGFISEKEYESMAIDSKELLALLISSLKTAKKRNVKP